MCVRHEANNHLYHCESQRKLIWVYAVNQTITSFTISCETELIHLTTQLCWITAAEQLLLARFSCAVIFFLSPRYKHRNL